MAESSSETLGPDEPPIPFLAEAMYGMVTDKPLVHLVKSLESGTKISPNEARRIARVLLETAEAADQDAMLYRYMRYDVGIPVKDTAKMIRRYREIRAQLRAEQP